LRRFCETFLVTATLWLAIPGSASAKPWSLRFALEPGLSRLHPPQPAESRRGLTQGATLALGVADLVWVQLLVERTDLGDEALPRRLDAWAGSVLYTIDVLPVTPFVEVGVGQVRFSRAPQWFSRTEMVPVLGLGIDVPVFGGLGLGMVARYKPVLDTAVLDSPGLATWSIRLSGVIGGDE
jgi:hypothetical protein